MQVIRDIDTLRAWRRSRTEAGETVALVPTMGYLHEGHLSLCRIAASHADRVVATIFVNPTQFGPNEDFESYPRDEGADIVKLAENGVHCVFLPTVDMMYPTGYDTFVEVQGLTAPLCGASRPGHFRGVTTIVCKLFHLVQPNVAVFGLKDYQQYLVIRKMVQDLLMDIQVVGGPIVRDLDGLALSSRNAYLSPRGREAATVLYRGLTAAREAYEAGERDPRVLREVALAPIQAEPLARVDYVEVLDAETLGEARPDRPMVVAMAVFVEKPRLIDNLVLGGSPGGRSEEPG